MGDINERAREERQRIADAEAGQRRKQDDRDRRLAEGIESRREPLIVLASLLKEAGVAPDFVGTRGRVSIFRLLLNELHLNFASEPMATGWKLYKMRMETIYDSSFVRIGERGVAFESGLYFNERGDVFRAVGKFDEYWGHTREDWAQAVFPYLVAYDLTWPDDAPVLPAPDSFKR